MDLELKRLWINESKNDYSKWEALLHQANIRAEKNIDYTVGIFEDEKLIGTGSLSGNVLKCIAICKQYTGGKVINKLISHLISLVFENGERSCYVYTNPESMNSFKHLGFEKIASVKNELVFMEKAIYGFDYYIDELRDQKKTCEKVASIVMNANPFTNGHLFLVETAAKENDWVHLFIVSEDISKFSTSVRKNLVKKGTAHINNLTIHDTKDYLISSATFPSYFLKENADVTHIHAVLDANIFKNSIAPVLNIKTRYVGEEPFSVSTNIYNEAMNEVFGEEINLVVLPRKEQDGEWISASKVRSLLKEDKWKEIEKIVPQTTFDYLLSLKKIYKE